MAQRKRKNVKAKSSSKSKLEAGSRKEPFDNSFIAFKRMNYIIMIAGVLVVALGMVLMALESSQYGFGVLGLTVGPIVITLGLLIEFFAIFYRPKELEEEKTEEGKQARDAV